MSVEGGSKTRHIAKTRHTPFFHQDGVDFPMHAYFAYQQTKSRQRVKRMILATGSIEWLFLLLTELLS